MKINKITIKNLKKSSIIVKINKDLSLNISISPNTTKEELSKFLSENSKKINSLIEKQKHNINTLEELKSEHQSQVLLFGNWLSIKYNNEDSLFFDHSKIYLPLKLKEYNTNTLIKYIYIYYANSILKNLLIKEEEKTGIKSSNLRISSAKSRWGTFNSKKEISLSYFLIACPKEIISYVICHELCHSKEMNHSINFHHILDSYYPQSQEYDKKLKEIGEYIRSIK